MHDDPHDEEVNPIGILEMTIIEEYLYKKKGAVNRKGDKLPNIHRCTVGAVLQMAARYLNLPKAKKSGT